MLLSELLKGIDTKSNFNDTEITDITDNTAKLCEGCVFVCIKGAHFDGHSAAEEAVNKGARAVVAEYDTGVKNQILVKNTRDAYSLLCANFYGNPSEKLHLIGITGTNGKTTTTFILKGIFDNLGIKSGLIGTVKNVTGDKEYPSSLTTPDSKELQRLFREMVDSGCKYCVMEVSSQALAQGRVKLTNGYAFSDLDEFDYSYEWICNGKAVRNGDLHLSEGNLLEVLSRPDKCGELCLNVYATLKESTTWAEKGFKVAKEQLTYHDYEFPQLKDDGGKATFKETPEAVEIIAADALFTIEKGTGALVSWRVKGEELLHSALEPYFWKPANDIQVRNGYNERLSAWENAEQKRIVKTYQATVNDGMVIVDASLSLPRIGAGYHLRYTVDGKGRIQVEATYQPEKEDIPLMPKFGMRMRMPSALNRIAWYGRGKFENYPDRKSSAFLGVYECGIHEFITNYIVPQDNANRCDTRWFMLGDSERWKIQVKGLQPLCFRIWPYGEEDLEGKEHAHELPERDFINLNIDSNIHGVGGNDGWGAQTMKPYTIDGNRSYRYGFIMEYMDKTE